MHRLIVNSAAAAHAMDSDCQAELIKALSDRIAELQTQVSDLETALLEYQEVNWLFEELELAAGERHVLLEKRDGEIWLSVRSQLYVGQSLQEAAMQAFEKELAHG